MSTTTTTASTAITATTASSTTLTPVSNIGKTILGTTRELEAYGGITPTYDVNSTLNKKYNNFPALVPTSLPGVIYFGIGIGGTYNISNSNLRQPYPVLNTNMDLYNPIPFRCVPVEQDLTPTEQALYRMRVQKTINGANYFCYYLKLITFNQAAVSITQTDPVTGILSPYTINYANLSPTPPAITTTGTPTSSPEINVTTTSSLPITGAEVTEAINILYNGNLLYATINELGLYSGQDQSVTGVTGSGLPITYTEAILAQLNIQYTWNGDDFSNPAKVSNYGIVNGIGSLLLA